MDQTPDAGMGDVWAEQNSLGKRDRDSTNANKIESQPAPALLPCGSNLGVEGASPAKPKDLSQAFQKENNPEAAGGDAKKAKKDDLAPGQQLITLSGQAGSTQKTSTEEQEQMEVQLPAEVLQMLMDEYGPEDVKAYESRVKEAPQGKPVTVLEQIDGKFNGNVFLEPVQVGLTKRLQIMLKEEKIEVGIYQQIDANGLKHTVVTVTGPEHVYKELDGKVFDFEDPMGFEDNQNPKIIFKGTSLKEWISKVGAVKERGMTFGINMGPFPRAPTDATINMIAPLLKMYGTMTHVIYYADHTITMGFALGDLTMPMFRKPIPVIDGGTYAGMLDATHNIRMVGVPNCMFCSGIGENHSGACAQNKAKMLSFLKRKQKLAATKGATSAEPHKPTRRGTSAGLRAVERKVLQENGQLVAKPAPTQP